MGGLVLGMASTIVTPPASAADGAGVPIFLVGCAGFAQVDVRVDQAGEFEHVGCTGVSDKVASMSSGSGIR